MLTFVIQGRCAPGVMRGMVAGPEDRAAAAEPMMETFGTFDFLGVCEASDAEAMAAVQAGASPGRPLRSPSRAGG